MTELRNLNDIPTDPADDSWQPLNLNTLPDQPPVRPNLAGTGLIYPGKRHVFSGPPESAKTLAAYCILIAITRTEQHAALIDFEMGAYDARQRLHELGATPDDISRVLYLEPDTPATTERIATLAEHAPALVVIDAAAGAYQLQGLDDNRRNEVETFTSLYINHFWRKGIATILIDHVVKDTEHRGRFAIGSERKLGGADVHLGFDTIKPVSRGTNGLYKITVHKDRGGYHKRGHLADLHLDSDPDTHAIAWRITEPEQTTSDTGYFRPTHLMEKVSIHLELHGEPITRTAVHDILGGRKDYILKAINALVTEGYVNEFAGENRAKLIQSAKPYREHDESANYENGSTMRAEPSSLFSSKTTSAESAELAQPSGSSPVPDGSHRFPEPIKRGGSPVPPYVVGEPGHLPRPDDQNGANGSHGWFDPEGELREDGALRDTYLDSIAPDLDPPPSPTDDIDWTSR